MTFKQVTKLYPYLIALLTIACFIFIFFESVPYLRFIVTALHISTLYFQLFLVIAWLPLLLQRNFQSWQLLLITLLICIVGESTAKTSLSIYRELSNIAKHPFLTYDRKMALSYRVYPGFYPAIREVSHLTPTDSTIFIPPQKNPWEIEGNAAMVNYFLYPRRVINLDINAKQIPTLPGKVYVLISYGSTPRNGELNYGWPTIPIPANHLWQIVTSDADHLVTNEFDQDYNPATDQWQWGLIEAHHD